MWHVTRVMWRLTRDTWHVTRDMWHVTRLGGVNILSKFQLFSSYRLWFMILWRSGGKGWLTDLMNDEAVYRTAPATPGLLNIARLQKAALNTSHWCWGVNLVVFTKRRHSQLLLSLLQLSQFEFLSCHNFFKFFFLDKVVKLIGGGSVINGAYPV